MIIVALLLCKRAVVYTPPLQLCHIKHLVDTLALIGHVARAHASLCSRSNETHGNGRCPSVVLHTASEDCLAKWEALYIIETENRSDLHARYSGMRDN